MFIHADTDGNGIVTTAEWDTFVAKLDADGDGEIQRPHSKSSGDCRGRKPGASKLDPDGDGVMDVVDFQNLFIELDANGDGELTRDELPQPARRQRTSRS